MITYRHAIFPRVSTVFTFSEHEPILVEDCVALMRRNFKGTSNSFLSSSSSIGGITTLNAEEQVVPCLEANKTLQLEEHSRKDKDKDNHDGPLLPKISVKEDLGAHNT